MIPWLTPRHRHALLLARPVAYVTPCGRGLWLRGRYQTALAGLKCDHVITDPPYSARTHKGHNEGVSTADRLRDQLARMEARVARGEPASSTVLKDGAGDETKLREQRWKLKRAEAKGIADRRSIDYAAWGPREINDFMRYASRILGAGWIVAMCSHDQHRQYVRCAKREKRYAFDYPIGWDAPGSRVRMTGDGPANWLAWFAVSRTRALSKWGSLPGSYIHTTSADKASGDYRIGGKPLALMLDLVRDYSRERDTVCDPCGGYATTGVAALRLRRRFIGVEMDADAWEHGRERLSRGGGMRPVQGQGTLF